MLKFATLIFLSVFCSASFGQEEFPLTELKFKMFFAQRADDDKTIYCLLGNGFFRTISSNEEDSMISEWLHNHPKAKAIPVSILGEDSKMPMIYIWAIDGEENLNLSLVRKGVFPGNVMYDAVHFYRLSRGTLDRANIEAGAAYARKLNPKLPVPKEIPPRRLIPDSRYEVFLKQLGVAQNVARKQKSGIWSDKFKEIREVPD